MKVHVRTYGCQMNERDSEAVASLLVEHGYELSPEKGADVVIVNTCSVREKAEDKAVGKLGLLTSRKKKGAHRIIGAIGCMVQRMGKTIWDRVPDLDFAVGTHDLGAVLEMLESIIEGDSRQASIGTSGVTENLAGHYDGQISAWVNVMRGCNRRCAYCIVPSVRGRERSRPIAEVTAEVRSLVEKGVREVTLLGQSVTSYGKSGDAAPGPYESLLHLSEPFPALLEAVAGIEGLLRVRFASSHPSGCSDELARVFSDCAEVCAHLHLPVQSGSDRILDAMGRGYSVGEYIDAVKRIRDAAPGLSVTTDIIVGFPSESEEDFALTRKLMNDLDFDNSFIFKYSTRPGTRAADLADDVPLEEKARRNDVLLKDQQLRGQRINDRLVGSDVEVLVEGVSQRNTEKWAGRTGSNKIAIFDHQEGLVEGALATIRVDRARPQTLYGKVVGM